MFEIYIDEKDQDFLGVLDGRCWYFTDEDKLLEVLPYQWNTRNKDKLLHIAYLGAVSSVYAIFPYIKKNYPEPLL